MGEIYYVSGNKHELFSDTPDLVHRTPWWGVSLVFHGAILILAMMIVVAEVIPEHLRDDVIIFNPKVWEPEINEVKIRQTLIERKSRDFNLEIVAEETVIDKTDIKISTKVTTPDNMNDNQAHGLPDAVSIVDFKGKGFTGVFGVGGGGSGPFGRPDVWGKDPEKGPIGNIPGPAPIYVDRALEWFKRHQTADGSWSFENYGEECKDVPACNTKNLEGTYNKWENAATGFALLCYLGRGHTHKVGKYRPQVINGLSYLTQNQADDGSFSSNNYVHAIATMAVAEAFGMSGSSKLEEISQKAVNVILDRQNEDGYMGWDYGRPSARSDTSVTGWQVMALKSAKIAGLDIGNSFDGVSAFIDKVTPDIGGDSYHPVMEHVNYIYKTDTGDKGHKNSRLTAIGLLCRVFMGQNTKGMMLRAHAEKLMESLPDSSNGQFYEWYYAALAMFQMGGTYWDRYKEPMEKTLCDTQRMGGCADGSWDPPDSSCHGARRGGRLFCTAVGCLTLEVYYRYEMESKKSRR